jgi:cobyrinic acid a,c-diamide synthase
MFHRQTLGVPAYNLDPFFCPPAALARRLAPPQGVALLEGAMGYYDGVGPEGAYSAWDVALATQTPGVLVVDARGMYASAGAVLKGFAGYKAPSGLRAVIFNNASPMLYEGLRGLAEGAGLQPLGFLPREAGVVLESRRLGLVAPEEAAGLGKKLALLAALAQRHLDLPGLLALAASAPALAPAETAPQPIASVRLAVARDEAFCFLYQENLDLLAALGCHLVFFSPLRDQQLPEGIGGLYLCGGYPELHLEALSRNTQMRRAIREAVAAGLPTVAECGGFLYLHRHLAGVPMVGALPADAFPTEKLQRFGYITLRAQQDNLLCPAGGRIRAHEFHYYDSTDGGAGFVAEKPFSARSWPCVHATDTLYAGFPHLYWEANPAFAVGFVRKAAGFGEGRYP